MDPKKLRVAIVTHATTTAIAYTPPKSTTASALKTLLGDFVSCHVLNPYECGGYSVELFPTRKDVPDSRLLQSTPVLYSEDPHNPCQPRLPNLEDLLVEQENPDNGERIDKTEFFLVCEELTFWFQRIAQLKEEELQCIARGTMRDDQAKRLEMIQRLRQGFITRVSQAAASVRGWKYAGGCRIEVTNADDPKGRIFAQFPTTPEERGNIKILRENKDGSTDTLFPFNLTSKIYLTQRINIPPKGASGWTQQQ